MRQPARKLLVTLVLSALCGGASCVSDGGAGGGYNGGGDPYRRNDPDPAYAPDHPNRIPRWADLVREGDGKLRWRADLDGTAYVYDRDNDVIRYAGPVRRGDDLLVQPADDRVSVGGRVVCEDNLRRDGYHQVFFAVAGRSDASGGGYGRDADYGRDRDTRPARGAAAADGIPAGARKISRGSGVLEIPRVTVNGVVYLYDEDAKSIAYHTDVPRGGTFRAVPREGKVYVDGNMSRVRFAKGHTLSLYFGER